MRRYFKATNVVLALLCAMYFITYIDRVNVSTAARAIQKELELSNTQLGLIFSAFAYPYPIFQVIGGWVGDRFGPRITLFTCGVVWALATALTGLAGGMVSLFLVRVVLGLGKGQRSRSRRAQCNIGRLRPAAASRRGLRTPSRGWAIRRRPCLSRRGWPPSRGAGVSSFSARAASSG